MPYDRCVAAGRPQAANSRTYAAAGATTPPPASTSRYGSNRSPVRSTDPRRATTSRDRSRAPPSSLIMGRERIPADRELPS